MPDRPKIGVLALQGNFEAHRRALRQAGADSIEVRTPADLASVQGLILPGGESSTMLRIIEEEQLFAPLHTFGQTKPVFGTCAGAILLATEVLHPHQESLGLMDVTVERNGYGRQVDSRITSIEIEGKPAEAVFIRAPIIRRVGANVQVLGTYLDHPVLVEEGLHLIATFHPEMTQDQSIHRRFVDKVAARSGSA